MTVLHLDSAAATEALGARLAGATAGGGIVWLRGDLGTGKTTLVRGLLRALGHAGPVRSPTYTLMEPYSIGRRRIFHLDLYRLGDPQELEYIGLRDLLDGDSILLVEWPERGQGVLPAADLELELTYAGSGRQCRLRADSSLGEKMLAGLAAE
ncbi:MAG: tRNA (adenosine(37)-N6)-threonylcarbamoyltransferase complex ATPase subunit type 1 TsaE [Pseudomonadota bacterium]|nr:tRNA (adenosine(37)-N6)-threonylcarbamoyltransferase complex ATPase subunit type 1 TsaE [Pseudomonadota bacterium]